MVVAILSDIVGSRALRDREAAQRAIDERIAVVDDEGPAALQPLRATAGDEHQGLYATLDDALTALLLLRLSLPENVDCRFGIGIGEVAALDTVHGEVHEGPAWWVARDAIDRVHTMQQRAVRGARTWIVGAPGQDEVMDAVIDTANAYLLARDHLVSAMGDRERRLAYGRVIGSTQRQLADAEGISQSAVSQALSASGATALLAGLTTLSGAVKKSAKRPGAARKGARS